MFDFTKKLKGREDLLSVTVPRRLADTYGFEAGDYVKVTMRRHVEDEQIIQFAKKLSKCGTRGLLLYIPTHIARQYELELGMKFLFRVEFV